MKLLKALSCLILLTTFCFSQTQLIGVNTVKNTLDTSSAGTAEAFSATASASGTATTCSLYLDRSNKATKVYFGIYLQNNGHPGGLVSSGTITAPSAGNWNTVTLSPSISITSGWVYHLAILGTGGTIAYRDVDGGTHSENSRQTNLTNLPSTWSSGPSWASGPLSAYCSTASGPPVVSITISPTTANPKQGANQQFTATVTGSTNTGVNWSVTQGTGTVNTSGLFTAPNAQETDIVRAQAQADTTKTASATVTIPAVSIAISPINVSVQTGGTQQFAATVGGTVNTNVTFSEQGNGTVSPSGLYTAPQTAENDGVTATSQTDLTKSASATITVTAPAQHHASLSWTASTVQNVTYNMYRAAVSGGPYTKINTSAISTTVYTDNSVASGQTYYYVARAVNGTNQESVNSNQVQVVIP